MKVSVNSSYTFISSHHSRCQHNYNYFFSPVDFQIISVLSWFDETLTLSAPLPLGKKSGVQWLSALEKAMSYSLSSYLNEAYLNLPDLLKGATPNDEKAGKE